VALAALLGKPLRIHNVRAKRDNPGLRPQHLKAVEAAAALTEAALSGAHVGSSAFTFSPKIAPKGGEFFWERRGNRASGKTPLRPTETLDAPGIVEPPQVLGNFHGFPSS